MEVTADSQQPKREPAAELKPEDQQQLLEKESLIKIWKEEKRPKLELELIDLLKQGLSKGMGSMNTEIHDYPEAIKEQKLRDIQSAADPAAQLALIKEICLWVIENKDGLEYDWIKMQNLVQAHIQKTIGQPLFEKLFYADVPADQTKPLSAATDERHQQTMEEEQKAKECNIPAGQAQPALTGPAKEPVSVARAFNEQLLIDLINDIAENKDYGASSKLYVKFEELPRFKVWQVKDSFACKLVENASIEEIHLSRKRRAHLKMLINALNGLLQKIEAAKLTGADLTKTHNSIDEQYSRYLKLKSKKMDEFAQKGKKSKVAKPSLAKGEVVDDINYNMKLMKLDSGSDENKQAAQKREDQMELSPDKSKGGAHRTKSKASGIMNSGKKGGNQHSQEGSQMNATMQPEGKPAGQDKQSLTQSGRLERSDKKSQRSEVKEDKKQPKIGQFFQLKNKAT